MEHIELFERLNQEDEFLPFDCGDADLNDYLLTSAKDYQRQLLAVTYYMADRSETILFFVCLMIRLQPLRAVVVFDVK